jgi:hypothetical protein
MVVTKYPVGQKGVATMAKSQVYGSKSYSQQLMVLRKSIISPTRQHDPRWHENGSKAFGISIRGWLPKE